MITLLPHVVVRRLEGTLFFSFVSFSVLFVGRSYVLAVYDVA